MIDFDQTRIILIEKGARLAQLKEVRRTIRGMTKKGLGSLPISGVAEMPGKLTELIKGGFSLKGHSDQPEQFH